MSYFLAGFGGVLGVVSGLICLVAGVWLLLMVLALGSAIQDNQARASAVQRAWLNRVMESCWVWCRRHWLSAVHRDGATPPLPPPYSPRP